jgi:hypothetical protein
MIVRYRDPKYARKASIFRDTGRRDQILADLSSNVTGESVIPLNIQPQCSDN